LFSYDTVHGSLLMPDPECDPTVNQGEPFGIA